HPGGVGLRRRGRPDAGRPVPPAVPRVALLMGLPGVPRPRGPGQGDRAPRRRTHRRHPHGGVPPRPGAEHVGDHRPPPRGEILHRLSPDLPPSSIGTVPTGPCHDANEAGPGEKRPRESRDRGGVTRTGGAAEGGHDTTTTHKPSHPAPAAMPTLAYRPHSSCDDESGRLYALALGQRRANLIFVSTNFPGPAREHG